MYTFTRKYVPEHVTVFLKWASSHETESLPPRKRALLAHHEHSQDSFFCFVRMPNMN